MLTALRSAYLCTLETVSEEMSVNLEEDTFNLPKYKFNDGNSKPYSLTTYLQNNSSTLKLGLQEESFICHHCQKGVESKDSGLARCWSAETTSYDSDFLFHWRLNSGL